MQDKGRKEYHSFNVKFIDDKYNWNTVEEFKRFCKEYTNDNYLQGIRQLLLTNKILKFMMEQDNILSKPKEKDDE